MSNKEIIEAYEYFLTNLEKDNVCKSLSNDLMTQLAELPEELKYIWEKNGFCSYGKGLWWLTNPRDFDDIVEIWLKGTEYWEPEKNRYHVIGRTAFGELYLWGEKSGRNIKINTLDGMIFPTPSYETDINNGDAGDLVCIFIGGGNKNDYDTYDQDSKHIFDRALKKTRSPQVE